MKRYTLVEFDGERHVLREGAVMNIQHHQTPIRIEVVKEVEKTERRVNCVSNDADCMYCGRAKSCPKCSGKISSAD